MMIEVLRTTERERSLWDQYLQTQAPDHHAFCWEWRTILEETFGHTPYYLVAREAPIKAQMNGRTSPRVTGILPLFHVRSMLFGSALVSVPYLNAGGVLTDNQEAFDALVIEARALTSELKADYLELRYRRPCPFESSLGERSHKVAMMLELNGSAEEVFSGFKPKLRSQIRRPSKSGMYAEVTSGDSPEDAALNAFYSVFSEHMRDLGTPVFPRALFASAKRAFGDRCRIITVWHEKRPVAAGITIRHGNAVEIPWASALRRHSREAPNMLLYWEAMKAACQDGARIFDFGRSSYDSGPYRFKQQWGPTSVPLHWYYDVQRGEMPDINPANPKYTAMVRCWRKLPLPVANSLGPWLTKSLP